MPFKTFLKRVYRQFSDHAVSDTAATLSYYFFFSLFPFLFFLATLTAYLPLKGSVNHDARPHPPDDAGRDRRYGPGARHRAGLPSRARAS